MPQAFGVRIGLYIYNFSSVVPAFPFSRPPRSRYHLNVFHFSLFKLYYTLENTKCIIYGQKGYYKAITR